MNIDELKIKEYIDACVKYELFNHNIDPRDTLEGTSFRLKEMEGYKYNVYDKGKKLLEECDSYVDAILSVLPGDNLVDYHGLDFIKNDKDKSQFEFYLKLLFDENKDEEAFNGIACDIFARFDVLGFIFFLKDIERYCPIRSRIFDDCFSRIGINSDLAGNCTWSKYNEFLSLLSDIKDCLKDNLNEDITLLDAHSFVWTLDKLDYFKGDLELVQHREHGVGIVREHKDADIVVEFSSGTKTFIEEIVLSKNILESIDLRSNSIDAFLPEEIDEQASETIYEGAKKTISVNAYERDKKAVKRCKDYYFKRDGKLICQICGFDFKDYYGDEYENIVHIHHIKPLSEIGESYIINPEKDLIPVCPNCHTVLHHGDGISINDLIKKIR